MTEDERDQFSSIRCGSFLVAHGLVDIFAIASADRNANGNPKQIQPLGKTAAMPVIIFAWKGSTYAPAHHSLN